MLSTLHSFDDVRIYRKEAMALIRAGYRVLLCCPGEPPDDYRADVIRITVPSGRLARAATGWLSAVDSAVKSGAAAVHIHDPELLPAAVLLKLFGKRVIYDAHENLPLQIIHKGYIPGFIKPSLSFAADIIERILSSGMDLVIGATPEISARLSAVTVRNLPDSRELKIPDLPKIKNQVCYAGLISEERGAHIMAEAARLAGIKLVLAGDFDSEKLKHELLSEKYRGNIIYAGRLDRDEIGALLARSMCGLCLLGDTPAYRKSIPIKLLEYMMAGLPFVASDFPAFRKLGGKSGAYVDPNDAKAAARAILRIVKDANLRGYMSGKGKRLSKRYSFQNEEKKLISAYKSLFNR